MFGGYGLSYNTDQISNLLLPLGTRYKYYYPLLDQIKNRLKDYNVSLSLPSQRVDRFDDDIANVVSSGRKRSSLTFAPEAGTQRLRDIINKVNLMLTDPTCLSFCTFCTCCHWLKYSCNYRSFSICMTVSWHYCLLDTISVRS